MILTLAGKIINDTTHSIDDKREREQFVVTNYDGSVAK